MKLSPEAVSEGVSVYRSVGTLGLAAMYALALTSENRSIHGTVVLVNLAMVLVLLVGA